jgi:valyl-tRNA synthetase
LESELQRLGKEKEKLLSEIARGEGMLKNPRFVEAAPPQKVAAEQAKLAEYQRQYELVCEQLDKLSKSGSK